ncbi:MAG: YdcF family protein [Bacteroidota bacterium]
MYVLSKLLPQLVYPLGLTCVVLVVAAWRAKQGGRRWVLFALAVLWLGSNRYVAYPFFGALESRAVELRAAVPDSAQAGAIVVLGGGTQARDAPRRTAEVSEAGDRVLYAAHLWRTGHAPLVVVSGGNANFDPQGEADEAEGMAALLRFIGLPDSALVLEAASRNTYENAVETKRLLDARGISDVWLVTSAFHMDRAQRTFEAQGLTVYAAPTDFHVTEAKRARLGVLRPDVVLWNLLPDAGMLDLITGGLKEHLGLAVYRVRGWI